MEVIFGVLAAQFLPALGVILIGLATWGISLLKKKTGSEIANNALDQLNQIIASVVGALTQTIVDQMKASAPDGKLTDTQKANIKKMATQEINGLVTAGVATGASQIVGDLQAYISKKIEEQVLAQKK
jgi:hypothetical protein